MRPQQQAQSEPLIVCHECDLLQRLPPSAHRGRVQCRRCEAVLLRYIPNSIDRAIALSLAGLILFIIANLYPFLSFELGPQAAQTTLFSGAHELYRQGFQGLGAVVFFTVIFAPLLQLLLMLYIFVPLKFNRVAFYTRPAFRLLHGITDWSMVEVFMIGILVALVKLSKMATIEPGIALWSFMALIFVITGASLSIDKRLVWERVEGKL